MDTSASHAVAVRHQGHRWADLPLVAIAQPMVVLDATIVNIALPFAQTALGFSTDDGPL